MGITSKPLASGMSSSRLNKKIRGVLRELGKLSSGINYNNLMGAKVARPSRGSRLGVEKVANEDH